MSEPPEVQASSANDSSASELDAIATLIARDEPKRVVLIGASAKRLFETLSAQCDCQHFDTIEACAAASADDRHADVALLWQGDDEPDADNALGLTCRLFPHRVVVRVSGSQPVMPASRFYAFGFQKVTTGKAGTAGFESLLYEYRLADYKTPPDWLNAQYWANPQRFDVLEPEYDDSGKPQTDMGPEGDEDDYEPEEDEYE